MNLKTTVQQQNDTMTAKEIFTHQDMYFGEATINGIDCSVGYIKKFRWRWFATQLNTFVMIGKATGKVDMQTIEAFSRGCFDYALKNNKGWPRGLQSAVGSIAILEGSQFDDMAILFCENLTRKHWSAFEIPVLYHTGDHKTIRFTDNPLWGYIYFPFFASVTDQVTSQLANQKDILI